MVNLLKNNLSKHNSSSKANEEGEFKKDVNAGLPKKEDNVEVNREREYDSQAKPDLSLYKDPEGLTIRKLKIGLWLVKNRRNIYLLFYTFIIMVNVLFWGIFFLNFGSYMVFGMKDDQKIFADLSNDLLFSQRDLFKKSARELKYGYINKIKNSNKKYDFVLNIENPNPDFYAEFDYYFGGGGFKTDLSHSFILPGQKKYITSLNQDIYEGGSNLKFYIDKIRWRRIDHHLYPDWNDFKNKHLNIQISKIKYISSKASHLSEDFKFGKLFFEAVNNTAYNYYDVYFLVLYFSGTKMVGVDKYYTDSFYSEEVKNFDIVVPESFHSVNDIKIFPEINITKDDIYIDFDGGVGELK